MRIAEALGLFLAACAPTPDEIASSPIAGGSPDWQVTSVGRLAVPHVPNGGCSGTLVAPRLVLTAKHCFNATQDMSTVWFIGGANPAAPGFLARGVRGFWAGRYSGPWVDGDDLYVIALDRVPRGIPVQPIGWSILGDESPGSDVELVGYGYTAEGANDDGVRRSGWATIDEINDKAFSTTAGWTGAASCGGDSGGAVVWMGLQLGVIARGNCWSASGHTRIDAHAGVIQAAEVWLASHGGPWGHAYRTAERACGCDVTWSCDPDGSPHGPRTACPCDPECA
jgi:hypothetical protein